MMAAAHNDTDALEAMVKLMLSSDNSARFAQLCTLPGATPSGLLGDANSLGSTASDQWNVAHYHEGLGAASGKVPKRKALSSLHAGPNSIPPFCF